MKKIFYYFELILSIINLQPHLIYASSLAFQGIDEIVDIVPQKSRSFGELYQSVEEKLGQILDIVYMDHLVTCRFMNDHTDNVFDRTLYWLESLKPDDFPLNWLEGSSYEGLKKIEIASAALLSIQDEYYEIFQHGKKYFEILQNIENNLNQLLLCIDHKRDLSSCNQEPLVSCCVRVIEKTTSEN